MTICTISWSNDVPLIDLAELEDVLIRILQEKDILEYAMEWGDCEVSIDAGLLEAGDAEDLIHEIYDKASTGKLAISDVQGVVDTC